MFIVAGVGLPTLAWLVWDASPHRPVNSPPSEATAPPPPAARPEVTFLLRQNPEDRPPGHGDAALRVRLDIDRLRAHDLCVEDVKKPFEESAIISSARPTPPPGVVFVMRLARPELYEKLILKADAEGEVVRLRDVGKVEDVRGQ
ncbi:MAG: hypothetical protein U0792_19710 [Gemmataceae bacterium]